MVIKDLSAATFHEYRIEGTIVPSRRYDLDSKEFSEYSQDLLDEISSTVPLPENGLVTALVPTESKYADLARTLEIREHFYEDPSVIEPYESNSFFMLITDFNAQQNDESTRALAHAYRLIAADNRNKGLTGIETVDDLIASKQITLPEILEFHGIEDINKCWSVGANIAAPGIVATMDKPYGAFGYKAIFEVSNAREISHLFTCLNGSAIKSLGRLGIKYELIAGRDDLLMPSGKPEEGAFDNRYSNVIIPVQENADIFRVYDPSRRPLGRLIARTHIEIVEIPPRSVFG